MIDELKDLFILCCPLAYIRSDNGPELVAETAFMDVSGPQTDDIANPRAGISKQLICETLRSSNWKRFLESLHFVWLPCMEAFTVFGEVMHPDSWVHIHVLNMNGPLDETFLAFLRTHSLLPVLFEMLPYQA